MEFSSEIFNHAMQKYKEKYGHINMLPFQSYPIYSSYYDRNNILASDYVDDLGLLLSRLRPDSGNQYNLRHGQFDAEPPIKFGSSYYRDSNTRIPYTFTIRLRSDVWYPYVYGYLGKKHGTINSSALFDNRELANRHTPRLNRFLAKLRERAMEQGYTWILVDYELVYKHYRPYITETGINLALDENA